MQRFGVPFNAARSDVAAAAGLTAPVICSGVDVNTYILEAIGCGVAFLDFDNEGWLDIQLLTLPAGTALRAARLPPV